MRRTDSFTEKWIRPWVAALLMAGILSGTAFLPGLGMDARADGVIVAPGVTVGTSTAEWPNVVTYGDSGTNEKLAGAGTAAASTGTNSLGTPVISGGSWQGSGDSWSYVKDGAIVTGWALIENPYATTEQRGYSWFRFDEKGKLTVGWFTDGNGATYYLNPIHDNTFGALCTGWYYIGGSWYYFEERNASRLGALYRNTLTPDNHVVDADGKRVK